MDFNTLFLDEREKGETRLRQCQLVMLRMLKIFDHLCSTHNIKYFLTGGSLLGAIRHQGFIPWDDDLDVGMTRENYEKFVQYAVPELPQDIFFQTPETDIGYPVCHTVEAKLKDKYSSYIIREKHKHIIKWHTGLQIDIFVYDKAYLPHNFFLYILNRSLIFFCDNNKKKANVLKFISKYSPFPHVYASGYINSRKRISFGTSYKKEKEIANLLRVKFEDAEVLIPAGWHSYLKRMYGNYMQLPPVEKQKSHYGEVLPDPFTPCNHSEILYWNERK
jgi:lipopolysaccharide cholinephosphotransferase